MLMFYITVLVVFTVIVVILIIMSLVVYEKELTYKVKTFMGPSAKNKIIHNFQ